MIFPKKCLGYPPFLGYICWPKVVGALLLLLAPLALLSFRCPCFLKHTLFMLYWHPSLVSNLKLLFAVKEIGNFLTSLILRFCERQMSFKVTLISTGGHARPGENFLKNLKNPGRMTGNIMPSPSTVLPTNTFFIFTPGNP